MYSFFPADMPHSFVLQAMQTFHIQTWYYLRHEKSAQLIVQMSVAYLWGRSHTPMGNPHRIKCLSIMQDHQVISKPTLFLWHFVQACTRQKRLAESRCPN